MRWVVTFTIYGEPHQIEIEADDAATAISLVPNVLPPNPPYTILGAVPSPTGDEDDSEDE